MFREGAFGRKMMVLVKLHRPYFMAVALAFVLSIYLNNFAEAAPNNNEQSFAVGDFKNHEADINRVYNQTNLPFPRMVIIGQRGVGKSTFSCFIIGHDFDSDLPCPFKTQDDVPHDEGGLIRVSGVTRDTYGLAAKWRNIENKSFTVVDTPGLNDPLGNQADKGYVSDMVLSLTDYIGANNMFLFCLKYDSTFRLDELKTFRTFHALFGKRFFDHLVIEVTWYGQTKSDRRKRRRSERRRDKNLRKMNSMDFADYIQNKTAKSLNAALKKSFPFLTKNIPVVFIDSYLYEFGEDEESDAINQREIDKLDNLL